MNKPPFFKKIEASTRNGISLFLDLINVKDSHNFYVSVSKFDCLSLVVCSNTTLLKLQTVLFLSFSKFCASKSEVRLLYGCGLYTDVYSSIFWVVPANGVAMATSLP